MTFITGDPIQDYVRAHYDNRYENMGGPDSFVSYGASWAEAGTAPFKRHKGYTSEGGITAPMIIAGPGVNYRDEVYRGLVTVMDLAPTFIAWQTHTTPMTVRCSRCGARVSNRS